jgi:hypothetical protein
MNLRTGQALSRSRFKLSTSVIATLEHCRYNSRLGKISLNERNLNNLKRPRNSLTFTLRYCVVQISKSNHQAMLLSRGMRFRELCNVVLLLLPSSSHLTHLRTCTQSLRMKTEEGSSIIQGRINYIFLLLSNAVTGRPSAINSKLFSFTGRTRVH